jgi:hypothetical protein
MQETSVMHIFYRAIFPYRDAPVIASAAKQSGVWIASGYRPRNDALYS